MQHPAGQRPPVRAVAKEGLLGKQGGSVKTRWQDRWVVAYQDKALSYRKWRSEEELLQGTIDNLDQCAAYPTDSAKKEEKDVVFHLDTPAGRTFRFRAESKEARDAWVAALLQVGCKNNPLPKPVAPAKGSDAKKKDAAKEVPKNAAAKIDNNKEPAASPKAAEPEAKEQEPAKIEPAGEDKDKDAAPPAPTDQGDTNNKTE